MRLLASPSIRVLALLTIVAVAPAHGQAPRGSAAGGPDASDVISTSARTAVTAAAIPDQGIAPAPQSLPDGLGPGAPASFYDLLDAAAQPDAKTDLAEFYRAHVGPFRRARGKLLHKSGATLRDLATETLESFMGLTSWTAADARDAVLETLSGLERIASADATGPSGALARKLERILLEDVASQARLKGRPGLAAALGSGQTPPGGWNENQLDQAGVQLWDYSLAATRLIDWIERRDALLGSPALASQLENPPDPAAPPPPMDDFEKEITALATLTPTGGGAGTGAGGGGGGGGSGEPLAARARAGAAELTGLLARIKSTQADRSAALSTLASVVGVQRINTRSDLTRLVRRWMRAHRGGDASMTPLEQVLTRYVSASKASDDAIASFRAASARHSAELAAAGLGPQSPASAESAPSTTSSTGIFSPLGGLVPKPILTEIYKQDISANLKLLDLNVAEGVTMAAHYEWALNGRVSDKYFTRVDTWDFQEGLQAGQWLQRLVSLPFGVGVAAHEKLVLARQFKDPMQAATAIPRTPLNLPLTAEHARAMDMGDFYSIPADIVFSTGIGMGYLLSGITLGGGVNYVVSGRFHVQIFKTDADHVRLRIVAMRNQGPSISGGATFGIQIFAIHILNHLVEQLVGNSLGTVSATRSKGLDFSADYVFDLRDPDACAAYDKVMNASMRLSPVLAANALLRAGHVSRSVLSDLRPAEDIFHADAAFDPARRRVNRLFKGVNRFTSSAKSLRIGIKYLRFDASSSWVDNDLAVYAPDESTSEYAFPVYSFQRGWTLLFGLFDMDRQTSLYALEPMAPGKGQTAVSELVITQTLRDATSSQGSVSRHHEELRRTLGAKLCASLDVDQVPIGSAKRFVQQFTLAIDGQALAGILDPAHTPEDRIWDAIARLMPDFNTSGGAFQEADVHASPDAEQRLPWDYSSFSASKAHAYAVCEGAWTNSFSFIAPLVKSILDAQRQDQPLPVRTRALMELGGNSMFRTIGARLLVELIDPARIEDDLFVSVRVDAADWPAFEASSGQDRFKDLYALVNDTLTNISDRDFLSR